MCRFWKLTRNGAVYAVITPETLFPQPEREQSRSNVGIQLEGDRQDGQTDTKQKRQKFGLDPASQKVKKVSRTGILISSTTTTPSPTGLDDRRRDKRQGQQRQQHRSKTQSTSTLISATKTKDGRRKTEVTAAPTTTHRNTNDGAPAKNPSVQASRGGTVDARGGYFSGSARDNSDRGKGTKAIVGISPELDRFGHRVQNSCSRRVGLPWGTLELLGWGWGGQFRFGSRRDGEELEPKRLHPAFRVRRVADHTAAATVWCTIVNRSISGHAIIQEKPYKSTCCV